LVSKTKEIGVMSAYAIIAGKMLQIGDQFDHYQIQAHMAQGGMSDIYRAFDLVNRREVVIKIPDQSMLGDPAQFERFQRELEVMKTLDHPAILKGLGSGKYNRIPYLVTQFVDGQSLRTLIESSAPVSPQQTVDLVRKIADGLAYCHKNEVIHRDLKPENILIGIDNQPVIMDFGLALTKGAHRVTYSNLSATMGTPDYMAPEQIEGQRGDQCTDVYALGTIMYELLTGKTPFTGDSNMAVMAQHLNGTAPRLDRVNPSVSSQLAAIVATCLARNPNDRYTDMTAFIDALDHPVNVDTTILENKNVSSLSAMSLMQMQSIRGILIAVGIMGLLVLLALGLQYLLR
jgi:eukaryotic-like serine/threonine-protein kinase